MSEDLEMIDVADEAEAFEIGEEPEAEEPREAPAMAPLIAVCGIGGGAGASTLAYLTAMYVQRLVSAPILLCDAGGPGASMALLAGQCSHLSLSQAATAIAGDALSMPLFVPVTSNLRLIAREPDFDDSPDPAGLTRLLCDARGAHPVTIVDCGTLQRPIEREVAEQASSILWAAQGSPTGARRAMATLRSLPLRADREILAVRASEERSSSVDHDLMSAADLRGAAVVFVPALPEVDEVGINVVLETGLLALEAIRGRLT